MAACHLFFFGLLRREVGNEFGKQRAGALAIVVAEIADIDIKRHSGDFGPGVDGEVGFGEDDCASDARWLALGIVEGMEIASDDGDTMAHTSVEAKSFERRHVAQARWRTAAVVQIGNQVQAIHAGILVGFT